MRTAVLTREAAAPFDELMRLCHHQNQEKGTAVRTALRAMIGEAFYADLAYNPAEYPTLIQLILEGQADVVYGFCLLEHCRRVSFF